jgi:hypothetical protein
VAARKATRTLLAEKLDAADAAIRRARTALDGHGPALSARTAAAVSADLATAGKCLERLADALEAEQAENADDKDA